LGVFLSSPDLLNVRITGWRGPLCYRNWLNGPGQAVCGPTRRQISGRGARYLGMNCRSARRRHRLDPQPSSSTSKFWVGPPVAKSRPIKRIRASRSDPASSRACLIKGGVAVRGITALDGHFEAARQAPGRWPEFQASDLVHQRLPSQSRRRHGRAEAESSHGVRRPSWTRGPRFKARGQFDQ